MFLAHSANDDGHEHPLKDHLQSVSKISQSLARTQLQKKLSKYIALFHDAGKYQQEFQEYLKQGGPRGSVPHAALGAALARQYSPVIIPFCIEGHHKGLADKEELKFTLLDIQKSEAFSEIQKAFEAEMQVMVSPSTELDETALQIHAGKEFELYIRYLFSILTDADWLDTECHFNPLASQTRQKFELDTNALINQLEIKFQSFSHDGEINELRNEVRDYAASKSNLPVGFFSLSLPTGMGKTLTSLYWALLHANKNQLRRIIIVLPFINIIDQTAQILKDIFGEEWVLEHHSGIIEDKLYDDDKKRYDAKKLASENWDYPIIVTTTVQFFESIFSSKPSKCRKIHNIADSVVIFDEVQSLPKHLVLPILTMLKNVSSVLQTTFLFCTATQPAFQKRSGFDGLEKIEPLVENPAIVFAKTKRVDYATIDNLNPIEPKHLLEHISSKDQSSLIIFNTKRETAHLFNLINKVNLYEKVYHLSTSMCPHHRKAVINNIRDDLSQKINIAVCSTQLIEAGVDFDFPIVYRALAPLESIIQSAGRCNREGKMPQPGHVYLFQLENAGMPDKLYRATAQFAKTMVLDDINCLHQHDSFEHYYKKVVNLFVDPDMHKIEEARQAFQFKTVNDSFKIINNMTTPLFIKDYNKDSEQLYKDIQYKLLSRNDQRRMQPFIVQVYPNFAVKYQEFIFATENGIFVWCGPYDADFGIFGEISQVDRYIV